MLKTEKVGFTVWRWTGNKLPLGTSNHLGKGGQKRTVFLLLRTQRRRRHFPSM